MPTVRVETPGLFETLKATQGLEADLRRTANGELRAIARTCAGELATELKQAAASSPTPQARLMAPTIRVKSDRIPVVSIGGSRRVGRHKTPAARLVWGSESGGRNFRAPAGGSYWIKPTVERFASSGALKSYRRGVYDILRKWRLV
jgi:hypothetical protein